MKTWTYRKVYAAHRLHVQTLSNHWHKRHDFFLYLIQFYSSNVDKCCVAYFQLLIDLSVRTNLHRLWSHRLPGEMPQPIRSLRDVLWARRPNQRSQSGGHCAVARRTALPKIHCVSPRLCCVGSVRCRLRPVCKETSFFIWCSLCFSLTLHPSSSYWDLSSSLSLSKFGIYPFSVCLCVPECVFVCGFCPFPFPPAPFSFSVWPPEGTHCWCLCACCVALSNWTSLWNKHIHTHTHWPPPLHFPIISVS